MRAWIDSQRFLAESTSRASRASAHSKRSLTPGPNSGLVSLIHAPWLAHIDAAWRDPEGLEPALQPLGRHGHVLDGADACRHRLDGRVQGVGDRRVHHVEGIGGAKHPARRHRLRVVGQEYAAHPLQNVGVACEPARDVEGRTERDDPVQRHAVDRRAHAEDAAVARRQPDRAPAVGADGEVDEPGGDRGRGAVGRSPRDAIRRARIDRSAVVPVLSPVRLYASSSVWVLPAKSAPASSNRVTAAAVAAGGSWVASHAGCPNPVRVPAMWKTSLAPNVRPASGPSPAPFSATWLWRQNAPTGSSNGRSGAVTARATGARPARAGTSRGLS